MSNSRNYIAFLLVITLVFIQSQQLLAQSQDRGHTHDHCSASPYPVLVEQKDKSIITIYTKGNRNLNWITTIDGYSIKRNANGIFEYADKLNGKLVPSGVQAHDPNDRSSIENSFLSNRSKALRPDIGSMSSKVLTQLKSQFISQGAPSTGNLNYCALLIHFKNQFNTYSKANFDSLFNGLNYRNGDGSFKVFLETASHGQLTIDVDVYGWYQAKKTDLYYANNNGPNKAAELVREAVDEAELNGVNFSKYDNDNDGKVDGIIAVHSGLGAEQGFPFYIWSHQSYMSAGNSSSVIYDGVLIDKYMLIPETRMAGLSQNMVGIGIACHQFGHILGLPDLLDTDASNGDSEGIGEWGLMGNANWLGGEHLPGNFMAWSRIQLGWESPTLLHPGVNGSYTLLPSSSNKDEIYRINTRLTNEYFLLENRQKTGLDTALNGDGLAIWHINTVKTSDTNNLVNADENLKGVDLEEADGLNDLDSMRNRGDAGDLFPGSTNNITFDDTSLPNAKNYLNLDTDIEIKNITQIGQQISFDFYQQKDSSDGGALDFDGLDDYVLISNNPLLNLGNEFTIEFWFKSGNLSSEGEYILDKKNEYAITYGVSPNNLEFVAPGHGGNNPNPGSQINVNDQHWHHIAYIYDGSFWKGYKDGVEVFSFQRTFSLKSGIEAISLGANDAKKGFGNFAIDELRIWQRSMCPLELEYNRNCENPGNQNALVMYYNFNYGIAHANNMGFDFVQDLSGNGNDGNLINFSLDGPNSNWVVASDSLIGGSCGVYSQTPILASIASSANESFPGAFDGAATATASGNSNFSYQWSTGEITASISSLTAGQYYVTVTDECGGTDSASVTILAPVVDAGGLDFDGIDDAASVPFDSTLNLGNKFTIEFWFQTGNLNSSGEYILDKKNEYAIIYGFTQNSIEFYAQGYGGDNPRIGSQISINDSNWHHIAYSYDGASWKGFKDGVEIFSLAKTFSLRPNSNELSIGAEDGKRLYADFSIDELRIWKRSLCQSEIDFNKTCEDPGNKSELSLHFNFNYGNVGFNNIGIDTISDLSGNGNHASLINFALSGNSSNWVLGSDSILSSSCGVFNPSASFTINVTGVNTSGPGQGDGSATVTVSGGSSYTFLWSNADTTATITSLFAGVYTVTVTDLCGATVVGSIYIDDMDPSSGMRIGTLIGDTQDDDQLRLNVYPNPAREQFTIQISTIDPKETLKIFDFKQSLIKEIRLESTSQLIRIPDLAEGVYILQYQSQFKKLIIAR